MILPRSDRVLIKRIEQPQGLIHLTDADKGMKGEVLAVGPGRVDEDGDIEPMSVKVGDRVLFNSKWNDLAKDHYDDLPLEADASIHLVQEADILCKIPSGK